MSRSRSGTGRVAVFCAHYPPHVGGVERYTRCLWSRMARRGWEVLIVTTDTQGPGESPADPGVSVWILPAARVLDGRVPVPVPSGDLAALLRTMRRTAPDVIVSNTRFFPTSALAAVFATHLDRPLLHIEHGSATVTLGRLALDVPLRVADRLLGSFVLGRADRCLAVSRAAAHFLRGSFGIQHAGVLSNGVETSGWDHVQTDYRARLAVGDDEVLIVYAGRLIEAKGLLDLLHVFSLLDGGRGGRLRLAVAGAGPLARDVAREAENDGRITFLGPLCETDSHDLLIAADVLVHPSGYPEGLPSVLLEAAAAGTAIIATAAGGTPELIEAGENGLIVPVHDRDALQEGLAALTSDEGLRARLGTAARRSVEARFDWRMIVDVLDRELLALLARRPHRSVVTARRVRFDRRHHVRGGQKGPCSSEMHHSNLN